MAESYTSPTTYESIDEIMARKQLLLKNIQKDAEKIDVQWHSLFKKPEGLKKNATTSQRLNTIINTGAGALDGFLLAWKLYRKFKR